LTNTWLACLSFSAATADIPDAGRACTRVIITLGQGDHLVGSTAATALDALICLRSRLNASHGRLRTPPEKHNSTNHIRAPAYISRSVGRLPRRANPAPSSAKMRSDKNPVKHTGSSFGSGSLQRLCGPLAAA
jgi:hypothetical protein